MLGKVEDAVGQAAADRWTLFLREKTTEPERKADVKKPRTKPGKTST
jgi:hypothetical protein